MNVQQIKPSLFSWISLMSISLMGCLSFIVPYHKWPNLNYYSNVVAISLGVLSLAVFIAPKYKNLSIPITSFVPLGLIIVLVVQWFSGVGIYWQETALGAIHLLWVILLMLATLQTKKIYGTEKIVQWLSYAILLGAVANAIVVLMQVLNMDQYFWTMRVNGRNYLGNLGQRNLLTNYLSLGLVSLLYLNLNEHLNNKITLFCVVLLLIALGYTGSRMSWLYILMVTGSFYWYGKTSHLDSWVLKCKYVLLLPLAFIIIQFTFPMLMSWLTTGDALPQVSPTERLVSNIGSSSIRIEFIQEALAMFTINPLLGIGWGQYSWYDLMLAETFSGHEGMTNHSHNLFAQMLAECGLIALFLVLLGSVHWGLKQLRATQKSPAEWWILLIAGIIFMHSMLEYPLWYSSFLGVFVIAIALADKSISFKISRPLIPSVAFTVIVFTSLIVISLTNQEYKQIEYWLKNLSQVKGQQKIQMLSDMTNAEKSALQVTALNIVLTRAYSYLPRKQAPLKAKIAKYEAFMRYTHADQDVYRYVTLLVADDRLREAEFFLQRALIRYPQYIEEFTKKIEGYIQKGDKRFLLLQEVIDKHKLAEKALL